MLPLFINNLFFIIVEHLFSQVRVGSFSALENSTGNDVCAEIGGTRPPTLRVNLTCNAKGRYIVLRKKEVGWWTIIELWAGLEGMSFVLLL